MGAEGGKKSDGVSEWTNGGVADYLTYAVDCLFSVVEVGRATARGGVRGVRKAAVVWSSHGDRNLVSYHCGLPFLVIREAHRAREEHRLIVGERGRARRIVSTRGRRGWVKRGSPNI